MQHQVNRRAFIKSVGFSAASLTIPGCRTNSLYLTGGVSLEKPNLLFVFADQFRRQALGFMNQDPVITPHFDRFARQGKVFTNAVSSFPVCSPFRATLMTGRFPLSTGVTTNCQPGLDLELPSNEICLSDVLKAHGSRTGNIGKWHLE